MAVTRTTVEAADAAEMEKRVLTTTIERMVAWARSQSVWPAQFGLACCAIEMISTAAARFDISRFGSELFRASPKGVSLHPSLDDEDVCIHAMSYGQKWMNIQKREIRSH